MPEVADKPTAPYLPYATFQAFIESLRGHPMPQRIDKTLMASQSGAMQSQLMTCLRFLGLVTAQDTPTPGLKHLVAAAKPEEWSPALATVIREGYKALDGIELMTITAGQLEEEFREKYGSAGETLEKAVRFYLKCLTEAKIDFSSRLSARQPRSAGTRRATKRTNGDQNGGDQNGSDEQRQATPPPGMITLPIHLPGKPAGSMLLPEDLDEDDCTMITAFLTAYSARRKKALKPA